MVCIMTKLFFDQFDSQVGVIGVLAAPAGVREVGWRLRPRGASIEPDEMVQRALGQLREYFAGQRREFTLPLDLPPLEPATLAVLEALRTVGVADSVKRVGGLDVEHDWDDRLTLEEQRLVSLARLLIAPPRFAVISHLGTGLGAAGVTRVLDALAAHGIGCIALGDGVLRHQDFDAVIEIHPDGTWTRTSP